MKNGRNCNKCKMWKKAVNFSKEKHGINGLYSICHTCKKEYRIKNKEQIKEWHAKNYIDNKSEIDKQNKKWREDNKEEYKTCKKNWRQKNPNKVNKRKREQYNEWKLDPLYNMQIRLRNRLNAALTAKSWRKTNKFNNIIGCSKQELNDHIESKFLMGMTWNNRNLWHVDHIVPLSSAKTIKELEKLSNYTNLQPLWAEDNIKKSDSCLQV